MFRINLALPTAFRFEVNNTQVISGQFSTLSGKTISVDWGDGGARSIYSGTLQAWSKDYGSAGNRTVKIYNANALTRYLMNESVADISFNVANLPSSLTYFFCTGSNTISGDIANLPLGLTVFHCTGSNTVFGDIASLPSDMTYFYCYGLNTVSGDISGLPLGLIDFFCYGSNTVSGDIANLPLNLIIFRCSGSNTVSGDIANLSSNLTYFLCKGSNTVSGYIDNLQSTLTYYNCDGLNTVSGDIANLPSGLTSFYCQGLNTVSDYTVPHTWSTKPSVFVLISTGIGGLSTVEIDNLLIDFDADLVWAAPNYITLTGTNASRSANSDAAVANIVTEGAVVTTN